MLAGPSERLAVDLPVGEQMPLEGFDHWLGEDAWRDDVTLKAPESKGSHVEGSFGCGSQ